ncbi:MAG: NADH:flavin oxidoreductase [Deltaproteobacteria bacterium]|nr:NADH:flavin oxidoreductase [Deltaproteobacteria bacterium]
MSGDAPRRVDPFAPARLGPITLRNRVIKSATFEGVMPDALVTAELIDYHRRVAAGGVGMNTVAYVAVAPDGRTNHACLYMRDEAIPGLRKLTEAIHAEGAKASAQIGHAGPVADSKSNGVVGFTASRRFNPLSMRFTPAATEADLERVIDDFRRTALGCEEAGFDALEVHLGHNYLLSAFLSPALNDRTDRWGGPLEKRARLSREVLKAVREAVGGRLAITAKLNMIDAIPKGLEIEESLAVAKMIESDGTLDGLVLTGGSSFGNPMFLFRGDAPRSEFGAALSPLLRFGFKLVGRKFMPDTPFEEAYFEEHARRFKDALDLPVILLGGVNNRATIEKALDDGFGFVQMGRALLREPDLLLKMQRGEQSEGVCIHCNRCMPSIYSGTRCLLIDPDPIEAGPPVA